MHPDELPPEQPHETPHPGLAPLHDQLNLRPPLHELQPTVAIDVTVDATLVDVVQTLEPPVVGVEVVDVEVVERLVLVDVTEVDVVDNEDVATVGIEEVVEAPAGGATKVIATLYSRVVYFAVTVAVPTAGPHI